MTVLYLYFFLLFYKVPLVKTWLAVLSGDFELEQREDFYSQTGVWVSLGAIAVSPSD
ncbi:hypothetical protein H6G17_31855 [Chroococcidiopsis sp. FACHB-1243]|uniref:hypothetical protein n=1 Tax=Chroococcidiopsis sp. [FACHB-1243] TaxID=2692781 RepID=UPI00178596E1|nr:hypothetical protein [Chroococcidiopsis sp. [FACHB-1243]]MBD2309996.1 hypothetical protein [Chroococcidiopsis sp. [FACHB-1243]]